MTEQFSRSVRAALVAQVRQAANTGTVQVVADLLRQEIAEAHSEMEHADDERTIWRAQGRAAGARSLLDAIYPRSAE